MLKRLTDSFDVTPALWPKRNRGVETAQGRVLIDDVKEFGTVTFSSNRILLRIERSIKVFSVFGWTANQVRDAVFDAEKQSIHFSAADAAGHIVRFRFPWTRELEERRASFVETQFGYDSSN